MIVNNTDRLVSWTTWSCAGLTSSTYIEVSCLFNIFSPTVDNYCIGGYYQIWLDWNSFWLLSCDVTSRHTDLWSVYRHVEVESSSGAGFWEVSIVEYIFMKEKLSWNKRWNTHWSDNLAQGLAQGRENVLLYRKGEGILQRREKIKNIVLPSVICGS